MSEFYQAVLEVAGCDETFGRGHSSEIMHHLLEATGRVPYFSAFPADRQQTICKLLGRTHFLCPILGAVAPNRETIGHSAEDFHERLISRHGGVKENG